MSARCTVVIARRANVLRLPETCVTGDGDKGTVQVVTSEIQNGKTVEVVEPRQIVAGLRGGGQVEIVSGLKEGDRVRPGKYSGPPRKGFGEVFLATKGALA
jgi:multidrug efflux pump subunit AcrA (membrane-fusion protein)